MKTYRLGGVVVAAGLFLAVCNAASPQSSGGAGYSTGTSKPQSAATTVQASQSKLGNILVDAQGRTLYAFTNDKNGVSTCEGACADAWPSVAANGVTMPAPVKRGAVLKGDAQRRHASAQGRQVAGVPLCR